MVPEFAIIGHPNEGKSSVLSTLAEDDSVRVSPTPGETRECRVFPVVIDGREVLRFTDTPGFQNPGRVLSELKRLSGIASDPFVTFRSASAGDPELHDDRELLGPVVRGAGIIYVVDGSRPLRNVDRAEMEILRISARPRLAIINSKQADERHLEAWKNEFRQHFNSFRIFNAHRATYAERILLLEALQAIDQDWQQPLAEVIAAFRRDWASRNQRCTEIIADLLAAALSLRLEGKLAAGDDEEPCRQRLFADYQRQLAQLENGAHRQIQTLFKHNIFRSQLPPHSLLHEEIFSARSWQLLGLTRRQVVLVGGLGGAAIGAGIDVAALGHGLGLFTLFGTLAGGAGAFFGGKNLSSRARFLGQPLGGESLQIGPAKSLDLLFVLLNRALLFYRHTINWAHGRREGATPEGVVLWAGENFTHHWSAGKIRTCRDFFLLASGGKGDEESEERQQLQTMLADTLTEISTSEGPHRQ